MQTNKYCQIVLWQFWTFFSLINITEDLCNQIKIPLIIELSCVKQKDEVELEA